MEENLAIRTTVEITVMLQLTFQLYRLHRTITVISLLVHLDLLAVATREMDMVAMAAVMVAEQHLLRLLYLQLLNHLKGLLFLNRWILRLATAMVVEAEGSKLMVEITSIIVARAVAVMMVDQVAETITVGIEGEMRMGEEVVDKDKEILDKVKGKDSKVKVKVNKANKDKASKYKAKDKVKVNRVVQRGKEEVKVSSVDMRVRGEDRYLLLFPFPLSRLYCISRKRK
jgi:hypothetical protein